MIHVFALGWMVLFITFLCAALYVLYTLWGDRE